MDRITITRSWSWSPDGVRTEHWQKGTYDVPGQMPVAAAQLAIERGLGFCPDDKPAPSKAKVAPKRKPRRGAPENKGE